MIGVRECVRCAIRPGVFKATDGSGPFCSGCRRLVNWELNHPGEDYTEFMRELLRRRGSVPPLRVWLEEWGRGQSRRRGRFP